MKRCVDSGLWIPDAKAAGMTPASEELGVGAGEAGSSEGEEPTYSELTPKPSAST